MRPPSNFVIAAKRVREHEEPVGGPTLSLVDIPGRDVTMSAFLSFWCPFGTDVLSSAGPTVEKSTGIIKAVLIECGISGVLRIIDVLRNKGQLLSVQWDRFAVNTA